MKGKVTISLDDFNSLVQTQKLFEQLKKEFQQLSEENRKLTIEQNKTKVGRMPKGMNIGVKIHPEENTMKEKELKDLIIKAINDAWSHSDLRPNINAMLFDKLTNLKILGVSNCTNCEKEYERGIEDGKIIAKYGSANWIE